MPPTVAAPRGAGKPPQARDWAFRTIFAAFLAILMLCAAPHARAPAHAQGTGTGLITNRDLQKTMDLLSQRQDPLVRKLIFWLYATESEVPMHAPDMIAFLRNNPSWPRPHVMRDKIEKNMQGTVAPDEAIAFFTNHPPRSYSGIKAYLSALGARGQTQQAQRAMNAFWTSAKLDKKNLQSLIGLYGSYLTPQLHAERMDKLIWEGRYAEAESLIPFAGPQTRATATARIALAQGSNNASALVAAMPAEWQNSEGVAFERMRWRRKRGMDSGALEMLAYRPKNTAQGDAWWGEINIIARRAIENRDYKTAHAILARHGLTSGSGYAQAEWLMGWLSLRFLGQPTAAYRHFSGLYDNVQAAISKSRAAYWSARAAEAMPDHVLANEWHKKSALYLSTFYGQLSHAALFGTGKAGMIYDPVLLPERTQQFENDERVRVIRLLHRTDLPQYIDAFLARLIADAKDEGDYLQIARLARETGRYYYSVQANKDIQQKLGRFLPGEGYPALSSLPLGKPEKALVHAIIHRESMFNMSAQSPVGARGLMQVMPGTAKDVSRQIGQSYTLEKLSGDPKYNVTLGSTYLQSMITRFDGFYPMAIAAYNAGPGRVDQWITTFGDPRKGQIDLIDWIELVPIYETRNYIQRVMESYYMYRLRFGESGLVVTDFIAR